MRTVISCVSGKHKCVYISEIDYIIQMKWFSLKTTTCKREYNMHCFIFVLQDVFELKYARMPDEPHAPPETSAAAPPPKDPASPNSSSVSVIVSSSDEEDESEEERERRLRELQEQVGPCSNPISAFQNCSPRNISH